MAAADNTSRDILIEERSFREIMEHIRCPICKNIMSKPILFCEKGHNFCNSCFAQQENCIVCSFPFTGVRNINLENISEWCSTPCPHDGCFDVLPAEFMQDHKLLCKVSVVHCPLKKIPHMICQWEGFFKDLGKHLQESHEMALSDDVRFSSALLKNSFKVILFEGEVFVYYKYFRKTRLECAFQRFGLSRHVFVAIFTLESQSGGNNIVVHQEIVPTKDDFPTMIKSGKGLIVSKKLYKNYIHEDRLGLKIFIKRN